MKHATSTNSSSMGAMTLAMNAATQKDAPRVLRLGLLHSGSSLEERLFRERSTISIGTSERAVLTAQGAQVPEHFELFRVRQGRWILAFTEQQTGRIARPDGLRTLEQLRSEGIAQKSGSVWELELSEQDRGKVSFGEFSVLFQFVIAPPLAPRPQLPVALLRRGTTAVDRAYNLCLAGFLAFASLGMGYVEYLHDPEVEDSFALQDDVRRLVNIEMPAPTPPQNQAMQDTPTTQPTEPTTEQPTTPSETHATQHATRTPSARPSGNPTRNDPERAMRDAIALSERAANAMEDSLRRSPGFAALAGATNTNRGSAVDRFAQGGLTQDTINSLSNAPGIGTANNNFVRRDLVASNTLPGGSPNLFRGRVVQNRGECCLTNTAPVERVIVNTRVTNSTPELSGEGELSMDVVGRLMRENIGAIRGCYNQAVRNTPTLSGRLSVSFTIGTSGRITGAPSTEGMDSAPEFQRCVATRIRSIVFPQPTNGSVSVQIPFNFSPGT